MRAPDWFLASKLRVRWQEGWLRLKNFNCDSIGSRRLDLDHLDEGVLLLPVGHLALKRSQRAQNLHAVSESSLEFEFEGEERESDE